MMTGNDLFYDVEGDFTFIISDEHIIILNFFTIEASVPHWR